MGTVVGLLLGAGVFCLWWSWWPQEDRPISRGRSMRDRLSDRLIQAGMSRVSPVAVVSASLILFVAIWTLMFAISRTPAVATCFALMAASSPWVMIQRRARTRRRATRAVWPEAVDSLVSGVRAGLSLPAALIQLADRGPEELREDFAAFALDYRTSGRFAWSLDRLKDRLADPVADRIIEALRVTREVGGSDLGHLLRTLGDFLRQDAMTRDELEARQSWTVNGARLAVAAPWLVLILLSTRPEAVSAYNRASGVAVLAVGAAVSVVAYLLMVRIGRLPEDPRVLR